MTWTLKKTFWLTTIENSILENKNLSWSTKGILVFILSRGDWWDFDIDEIVEYSPDSKEVVLKAFEELEKEWILEIRKNKNENWEEDEYWVLHI